MSGFWEDLGKRAIVDFVSGAASTAGNRVLNDAYDAFDNAFDDSDNEEHRDVYENDKQGSEHDNKLISSDLEDLQHIMNSLHTFGYDAMSGHFLDIAFSRAAMHTDEMIWNNPLFESLILNYYKGELRSDKPHGIGVYKHKDSEMGSYEGEWRFGKPHGEGVCMYAKGIRYEGEWRFGKPHGEGVCTIPADVLVEEDDARYDGVWLDGKPHEKGVYTSENGDRYEGEWLDGKPHGKGIFSGRLDRGEPEIFVDGVPWESQDDYTRKDTWYVGEWFDGYPHGKGVFVSPDGRNIAGYWRNGKLVDVKQVDGKLADIKLRNFL